MWCDDCVITWSPKTLSSWHCDKMEYKHELERDFAALKRKFPRFLVVARRKPGKAVSEMFVLPDAASLNHNQGQHQ